MDMILKRAHVGPKGAFGTLAPLGKPPFAVTLEHAYDDGAQGWTTKLQSGTYTCVRGLHQLEKSPPFVTFEVTGIQSHSGILFHKGNVGNDSRGCILLGLQFGLVSSTPAVLQSTSAFIFFMGRQSNVTQFQLTVA